MYFQCSRNIISCITLIAIIPQKSIQPPGFPAHAAPDSKNSAGLFPLGRVGGRYIACHHIATFTCVCPRRTIRGTSSIRRSLALSPIAKKSRYSHPVFSPLHALDSPLFSIHFATAPAPFLPPLVDQPYEMSLYPRGNIHF